MNTYKNSENDKVRGAGIQRNEGNHLGIYPKHQQRIAAHAADFNIWIARNKPGNDGVGAGVLGFFINPPLALYYMQGLLTTATHGHAALFGVYGLLGIGLLLFCMRGLNLKNIA